MKKILFRITAVILCLIMTAGITVSAESSDSFIHYDTNGEVLTIIGRDMYEPVMQITNQSLGVDSLEGLTDVYSKDGYTYLLCGEKSRLFKLNPDYSLNKEIIITAADGSEESYKNAAGVFVDDKNNIYVSDTENGRVLIADSEGVVFKVIEEPQSDVIPEDFLFQPSSIVIDTDGNYYIVSVGSFYGALLFSSEFEFKGFYGANTVQHTALDALGYIWDLITTTDEKRAQDERVLPYAFNDITIDKNGYIYTVTGASSEMINNPGQIQMLSPGGQNILYKRENDGISTIASSFQFAEEKVITNWEKYRVQNFSSVVVNDKGFILALDSTYGIVYVYDEDCNLITAFGGGTEQGNQLGLFSRAQTVALNGDQVLVIDIETLTVTVFELTEYGTLIGDAQTLYLEGNYEDAKDMWTKALAMDSNSVYAYRGLAKAYYTEGDYETAMDYAEIAYDYVTYDLAYQQVRNEMISKNFVWIFFLTVAVLIGLVVVMIRMKKREKALITNVKLHTLATSVLHPFNAFKDVKYKGYGSMPIAAILIILFTVSAIVKETASSFLFRNSDVHSYNSLFTLATTAGVVILWIICNYLASTLMSGKGTFKDITIATSYSLLPMIFANFLVTIISYVLTYDDKALINTIVVVATIYTFYLLFVAIMTVHDYGLGKFLFTAVVALFFMILAVFIIFMVVIMLQQLFSFLYTVYMEVAYR